MRGTRTAVHGCAPPRPPSPPLRQRWRPRRSPRGRGVRGLGGAASPRAGWGVPAPHPTAGMRDPSMPRSPARPGERPSGSPVSGKRGETRRSLSSSPSFIIHPWRGEGPARLIKRPCSEATRVTAHRYLQASQILHPSSGRGHRKHFPSCLIGKRGGLVPCHPSQETNRFPLALLACTLPLNTNLVGCLQPTVFLSFQFSLHTDIQDLPFMLSFPHLTRPPSSLYHLTGEATRHGKLMCWYGFKYLLSL